MIRRIPFACTTTLSEPVLSIDAALLRWTNAGRRPTAGRAASARITLVRPRQCDGTIVRLAKLLGRAKRRSIQFVEHLTGDGPYSDTPASWGWRTSSQSARIVLCVMQIAFWYRVLRVPIPLWQPRIFLNHVLLFLGRLSFIFGSALFGIVVFRHLPELDRHIDLLLTIKRGAILLGCLRCFAPALKWSGWGTHLRTATKRFGSLADVHAAFEARAARAQLR
jgi:hypothetical protein